MNGLYSRCPLRKAAALYHLGMRVTFDAKEEAAVHGMRDDQEVVLNIFVRACNNERLKQLEAGYGTLA